MEEAVCCSSVPAHRCHCNYLTNSIRVSIFFAANTDLTLHMLGTTLMNDIIDRL